MWPVVEVVKRLWAIAFRFQYTDSRGFSILTPPFASAAACWRLRSARASMAAVAPPVETIAPLAPADSAGETRRFPPLIGSPSLL
jgi:hypothetical protein